MKTIKYIVVALLVYLVACQVMVAITKQDAELSVQDKIIIVAVNNNFKNINFLLKLAEAESEFNPDCKVLDTNNRYSYGLLNFQMETYTSLCVDRYGLDSDIYSIENQIKCYIEIHENQGVDFIASPGGWYNSTKKINRLYHLTP